MNFVGDYHSHSTFSDGKSSIESDVKFAEKAGLKEIAITDHGYSSTFVFMTKKKWDKQKAIINNLDTSLKVYHGIESNILSDGSLDVEGKSYKDIDVLIAGFHRFLKLSVLKNNMHFAFINGFASKKKREKEIENNTKIYKTILNKYPIDIVAHLNNRALVNVKEVLDEMAKTDTYLELNEKHVDTLYGYGKDIVDSNVKIIISSDAHHANDFGSYGEIEKFIVDNNIPLERVYGVNGNMPKFKEKG